jgi:hypothetical protein
MTGIDGYDWSPFGGNPVPGDPDAVRAIAGRFADVADSAARQNGLVRQVGSDSEAIWVGPAADKFRPHLGRLPGQLDKLATSYRDAADALNGYWPRLRSAQQLAVTALAKARAAQGAIASAGSQVSAATAGADQAASSYNQAATALAAATNPPASQAATVKSLQSGYQAAQVQLSQAHAALAAANSEMAAAHQMKDQAVAQARSASAACADCLHAASAAGIQNPHPSWLSGIFDDIGLGGAWHWVEDHWSTVKWFVPGLNTVLAAEDAGQWLARNWVAVAKDASAALGAISTVAGFMALIPVVGEVALPVALAAAGLQTVDDIALAGTGNGSWGAVGLDAVGDVGFGAGEGLTHLARGLDQVESLTSGVEKLTAGEAALSSKVTALTDASSRWEAMAGREVFVTGPDGVTQLTKGADMAAQARSDLVTASRDLTTVQSDVAAQTSQLGDLNTALAGGQWRYAIRTFAPGEDGGTLGKLKGFFQNPVAYTQAQVGGSTGAAESSLWSRITREGQESWTGAGRWPYRLSVGVGLAGTGLGGSTDAGAWHDVLAGK